MINHKKQKLFISIGFGVIFIFTIYLLFAVSPDKYSQDQFATDEQVLQLGLRISLLPPESEPSKIFFEVMKNDKLSLEEHKKIENLIDLYLRDMTKNKKNIDVKKMTKLEKAKANLDAFDEIGYLVVPKEKMSEVRSAMVENIKLIEREEAINNK